MTDAIRNISTQTNNNIIKQDEVQKKTEGDTPLPKELSHAKGVSVKSTVLLVGLSLVTCGAAAVLYCAMAGGYSFFNYVKSMYSEVDSMLDSLKEENQVANILQILRIRLGLVIAFLVLRHIMIKNAVKSFLLC